MLLSSEGSDRLGLVGGPDGEGAVKSFPTCLSTSGLGTFLMVIKEGLQHAPT